MIRTIGELKKAIATIDDDFTIDVRIVRELSEEELKDSSYPYPYEYIKANLEIGDIGYSDKDVFINVEKISDDVCEWKFEETNGIAWHCDDKCTTYNQVYIKDLKITLEDFECKCPYCGKKIKVVE